MKTLNNLSEYEAFGLVVLTGEADALNRRLLFDVQQKAMPILAETLSVQIAPLQAALQPPWNGGEWVIGSILLERDSWTTFGIIALLKSGCVEVWEPKDGGLMGMESDEEAKAYHVHAENGLFGPARIYRFGPRGSRNQHAMSGRVA